MQLVLPINIQLSKIVDRVQQPEHRTAVLEFCLLASDFMVGLGRLELPTSSLSGTRSSHLSYRPVAIWWSWSGSNRRPPECKSGALPAELQPLTGSWLLVRGCWFRNYEPTTTNHKPEI